MRRDAMATAPATPFDPLNTLALWRQWAELLQASAGPAPAGGGFVQPILPGWSMNINSHNSSAPQTEADVLAVHSYGRQIGRIADALHALLQERAGQPHDPQALQDFGTMWQEVERVKTDGARQRLAGLASDLDRLARHDRPAYERLRGELQQALAKRR